MTDVRTEDLRLVQDGEDLQVTSATDLADGYADTGVMVEDFFLGGNNVIERLYGADGIAYYDLTVLIA